MQPSDDTLHEAIEAGKRHYKLLCNLAYGHSHPVVTEAVCIARAVWAEAMRAREGWVTCSERMPDVGEQVLVWLAESPGQGCSHLSFDCWDEQHESPVSWSSATIPVGLGWDSGTDWYGITHWMPLPEPPTAPKEPTP